MDDNFDADKFIALIETKESIWNYKSKAYNNKAQRRDDWMSVCEAMVPDLKEKSSGEKFATAVEFQGKWKILRDGFTRSLKNSLKKGSISICKRYAYYDQLQFLMDLYEDKTAILNETERTKDERRRKTPVKHVTKAPRIDVVEHVPREEITHSSTNVETISTSYNNYEEDKQFLLSLLSDFRKIPEDRKLDCKGDIINVIRHYKNTYSSHFPSIGSFYSSDIAAFATTAIESTNSPRSSFYDNIENAEDSSRGSSTLEDIKLFDS